MFFLSPDSVPMPAPTVFMGSSTIPVSLPTKDTPALPAPLAKLSTPAEPPSYEEIVLDPNGPRSQTNLFVRKLASAVTEEDMRKLFDEYGTIMSFALMRDIHTGESLGTAFVRFSTHEEARTAMAALDGRELYGRPISIQWAKREHDSTPSGEARRRIRKLFVRNIPLDITARHLRQVFSKFGAINNVTLHSDTAPAVVRDNADGTRTVSQMRNIAFILFLEDEVAERAVDALHNTCPFESCEGIPLMVKLAEDNRDRIDRKQRFSDSGTSIGTARESLKAVRPNNSISGGSSVSPQTISLSTPLSSGLSPVTMSMDMSHNGPVLLQDGRTSSLMSPYTTTMMTHEPNASTPGLVQTALDANGNATYVFMTSASPSTCTVPAMMHAPNMPGPYIMTSAGLQPLAANPIMSQASPPQSAFYAPASAPTVHPFYSTMPVQSIFVDGRGNALPPQGSVFVPNYYSASTTPLQTSIEPTAAQSAQNDPLVPSEYKPMPNPESRKSAALRPLQTTASSPDVCTSSVPRNTTTGLPKKSRGQRCISQNQLVTSSSPQLSSPASYMERAPTAIASSDDSPVNAAMNGMNAVPVLSSPPVTISPCGAVGSSAACTSSTETPWRGIFGYDSSTNIVSPTTMVGRVSPPATLPRSAANEAMMFWNNASSPATVPEAK